ncbi:MAG: hypothetical protein KJ718_05695 [Nanoarchaeota archaeon]|nr:hypothetical protein [Nanoarchaeota archaeon]MBU1052016.1 hypothetical protein [Nanoarchaeota archaeon]MBU1988800.1 hypothetical protein [Nanoarchaeota archaeon]
MKLIAFVGNNPETYGQISALVNRMNCEKVILVKDKKTSNPFQNSKCTSVDVDPSKDLISFRDEIREKLKKELSNEMEVALSIASGSGKEHMALISALLTLPVGIKFTAFTKKGVEFIS